MIKVKRCLAFVIDMYLGFIISYYIGIFIMRLLEFLNFSKLFSVTLSLVSYFYSIYLLIINRNYLFFKGQSLGQKIFKLYLLHNGEIANKKITCKKNFIDFLTFSFGIFTILFFNKSVGDIMLDINMVVKHYTKK